MCGGGAECGQEGGLNMTMRQKLLTAVTTAMLILTGINALVQAVNTLTDYGCKRGWWEVGCTPTMTRGHN